MSCVFFKQKTAYEMRISDWSSDVCSSDLMIRLRHASQINGREANEIILLNSHDGTSSYQMLAGMFRFVCQNGLVCGDTVADVRVPHKGDVAGHVIEGDRKSTRLNSSH